MELVQTYGAVLYDRASAAGLSFFVFPAPVPDSEERWEWDQRNKPSAYGIQTHCVADPLFLSHALVPMLAGLPVEQVAELVTAAKDDPQTIRRSFYDSLVEMAEHAANAPIIPLQGTPLGFQSLASFASQLRVDPGAVIGAPVRSSVTPLLVILGHQANVLVKSTTSPGEDFEDYANFNVLDDFLRRLFMDVQLLSPGELPSRP
jgi:hypothetical protein